MTGVAISQGGKSALPLCAVARPRTAATQSRTETAHPCVSVAQPRTKEAHPRGNGQWLRVLCLGAGVFLAAAGHAQSTVQTDLPPVPALPDTVVASEPGSVSTDASAPTAASADADVSASASASAVPAAGVQPVSPSEAEPVQARTQGRTQEDPNAIRVLLSPELETTLAAQIVGRIAEMQAGLGTQVKQGDLLVRFDCQETDARLKMAQAESAAARETLGVKQRLRRLDAAGETEVTLARIDVQRSAAAIEVAQAQLAHCKIEAPFDGRIVKVHAKQHQSVNVGAPLLELVSEGPLKLRMNVPSRLLRSVQMGSPVEVDILETGRSYAAEVSAVNARVDAVAQTIELEARLLETPPELLPGMSGVARFTEQS